jgi:hypothetical protein
VYIRLAHNKRVDYHGLTSPSFRYITADKSAA